jgi:hypothetical protein
VNIAFDASTYDTLLVCGCGWRDLQVSPEKAWLAAHSHALAVHPADFQLRDQLQRRKKYALTSC